MTVQPGADNRPVVVLADDEPDVLGAVAPFLERSGLRVITAPDGKLALDEIRRHKPDVCVLDVLMPGADGREVLRTLRDEGTTNSVHDKMLSFSQFNSFIGLDDYNELDKKYK